MPIKDSTLAEVLVSGPRGRRMLLAFAEACDAHNRGDDGFSSAESLRGAVQGASQELDPDGRTSGMWTYVETDEAQSGPGLVASAVTGADVCGPRPAAPAVELIGLNPERQIEEAGPAPAIPMFSPEQIAGLLDHLELLPVSHELLREALATAVDNARYWQRPDGEDVLAAAEPVRQALVRVAEHIAASPCAQWWTTPVDRQRQWAVVWEDQESVYAQFREPLADSVGHFSRLRDEKIVLETEARREQPDDPENCPGGEWWSMPDPFAVPVTTRELADGSPSGLWFVEDGMSWEKVRTRRLEVAASNRIFEIDSAEAWAELCRRFGFECTYQKRGDWYQTTGRDGRWVVPDWAQVAEHFDAVHLQPAAYLQAAGVAIPVEDDLATVIAGWNPDETHWFGIQIRYIGDPVDWESPEQSQGWGWQPAAR